MCIEHHQVGDGSIHAEGKFTGVRAHSGDGSITADQRRRWNTVAGACLRVNRARPGGTDPSGPARLRRQQVEAEHVELGLREALEAREARL